MIATAACATLPQPPPIVGNPGTVMTAAVAEGFPLVPTRAIVSGPHTAPVTLHRRFEAYDPAAMALAAFDPRFSFAYAVGEHAAVNGHIGWWMSGLELRVLPRGNHVDTPVILAVGAQVDAPAMLLGSRETLWDVRAMASVHPAIHRVRGILGAGLSAGRQQHTVSLPDGPLAHASDAGLGGGPNLLRAERREARLEGALGFAIRFGTTQIALAVQPFYVVAQGDITTLSCGVCSDALRVDSLHAPWGAVFTISVLVSPR